MTPALLLAAALLTPAPPARARAAAPAPCNLPAHRDDVAWIEDNCDVLSPARDERVRVLEDLLRRLERLKDLEGTRLLVLGRAPAVDAFITKRRVIVITRQALELCYPGGALPDDTRAQANLAFVLGHELAHWDYDDRFVVDLSDRDERYFEFAVAAEASQELKADRSALMDLARAGLDVRHVLDGSLLRAWAGAQGSAKVRLEALRGGAKEVGKALRLFDAGSDFLAAGWYATAAAALGEFGDAAAYEGREVLNDQAFALLQQALAALNQCERASALRFVWPGMFDPRTLASVVTRGEGDRTQACRLEKPFRDPLDRALWLLKKAAEADPDYLPARLNLVAAHLLNDKPNAAQAVLDDVAPPAPAATRLSDEEIALEAARALAQYLQGELHGALDLRRKALDALHALARARPTDANLLFNLARLQTELQDLAAVETWQRVLKLGPPRPLADEARRQLRKLNVPVPAEAAPELEPPPCPPQSVSASGVPTPGKLFSAKSAGMKFDLSDGSRWRLLTPPAVQGKPRAAPPGPPTAWRAYAPVAGAKSKRGDPPVALVVEPLAPAVLDLHRWHGTSEAELRLVGGRRVLRFGTCARDGRNLGYAYVLDGDQAIERLTFLAAQP